ncbi:hypothetical protein AX16_003995 [Volvariella volvacea WC 439]|nr:hypothetical protein AX16_003995 [Volvariella volvacea WC 439]
MAPSASLRTVLLARQSLASRRRLIQHIPYPSARLVTSSSRADPIKHEWFVSRRGYTQEVPDKPAATPKPPTPPKPLKPTVALTPKPTPRHEVQEGTEAVNLPYNPPGGGGGPGIGGGGPAPSLTNIPVLDSALATVIGLAMVFVGGVAYLRWYKYNVLQKIEAAFEPGYDPALELAKQQRRKPLSKGEDDDGPWSTKLRRVEQDEIDSIVHGQEPGHYYILLGPKGSGKGTMIFEAMSAIHADGVSMCDAHPDLEVFRLRLGKALNYEFNEDTQTGLFQRRDPREGGPALDIERALNKLEKVALRLARKKGRPLVLIVNNVHYFNNDEDGRNMLLQLQQRAEAWAASGILTMVFTSDDFWPFQVLRRGGSRMHVLSVTDLEPNHARHALERLRKFHNRHGPNVDPEEVQNAVHIIGGRLAYLNRVSKGQDMVKTARHLLDVEKGFLRSRIGLIPDCDDDVMDEQKWSSCSWLLLVAFVKQYEEEKAARLEAIEAGEIDPSCVEVPLPKIPYWRCREIMTRADFLEGMTSVF